MLFFGSLRGAGYNLVHLLTATIYRNALVPDHRDDIAAMLTNKKLLFHKIPPSMESVSEIS
jgi:hypothetical protein